MKNNIRLHGNDIRAIYGPCSYRIEDYADTSKYQEQVSEYVTFRISILTPDEKESNIHEKNETSYLHSAVT